MNVNMLRDADDDAGFYAAACAVDPLATWRGATLFSSSDGGTSYQSLAAIASECVMGLTTNALGDFSGGNIPDELNVVNVQLFNGALSSTTNAGLLAGMNACIIGDEILCFRDATLEANGTYTLRGLLRGRRGSEYAMADHAINDRFVLVDTTTMVRIADVTASVGVEKLFKAVSAGSTLAATTAKAFTNEGTGLKPYAPVHLGGGRNAAGDVIITWVRRNRISGEWRDAVEVPNSESTEEYKVQIFAGPSVGLPPGDALRTTYGVTSPTLTYTAAEQVADGLTPGATVYFRVYQVSAAIGYGHPADGSV